MIPPSIFTFLKNLALNNNKIWFEENKEDYLQAKSDFEAYIEKLIGIVQQIDPKIGHPHAKECIFRIYRDVRFSKDKQPYKNNFGAYISHGGRKSPYAGYYLHIEPDNSFLGGGEYCPGPPELKAIRQHIIDNSKEYKTIIENTAFKKVFPEILGEKLKTAPKGFPKDDPNIELIKPKSYTLLLHLDDKTIQSPNIEEKIIKTFSLMKPYNDFLNRAVKHCFETEK